MRTKISTFLMAMVLVLLGVKAHATTVTVGVTGTYASISAAITGVGTISEPLIIELTADYAQTADDITAIAGANATNTVTIRPQSGVSSLVVAGSSGYVWRLNGCSYVTIDGRAGGVGAIVLTLRADTTVGASLTTALKKSIALQTTNSATNNTVQYVNLRGATNESFWNGQPTVAPTMGVITIGAGSVNITIDHCDVGPLHNYTGTPTVSILSLGTLATPNSGIVISNNNIYDYFARDLSKCATTPSTGIGVLLLDYTTNSTVSGNSFYQTLARTTYANTNNARTCAIAVQNTIGNGFIIKDNYIGGSAPLCAGSNYLNNIANNSTFCGIYTYVANTGTTAIYGNTIKNIMLLSHSQIAQTYQCAGIYVNGGSVLVGIKEDGTTASANIIGDQSPSAVGSNAAIKFTGTNNNAAFSGVMFNSLAGSSVKISNNKMGGICLNLYSGYANLRTCSFVGVNIFGTGQSTAYIENNEIGNNATGADSTSMSIQNYLLKCNFGIYMNSSGAAGSTLVINGNKINNMYKSFRSNSQTFVNGIWINTAVLCPVTITNNEIRDLAFSSGKMNDVPLSWSSGITVGSQAAGTLVQNNKVYNIEGFGVYSTSVMGICLTSTASTTSMDVSKNQIYNLSSTKTRKMGQYATGLTGIFTNVGAALAPTFNVYNNMVRLGYNRAGTELATKSTIVGIRDSVVTTGAAHANYYNNTIYIGGTGVEATDTVPTFGISLATSATNAVVRNIKNNLIVNARSNATTGSGHYAIVTGSTNAVTNLTASNNDYAVTGTGGILGRFTTKTDAPTLSAIQSYTGDANSINATPVFVDATNGSTPNLHLTKTLASNSALISKGVTIGTVTTDFDGNTRDASVPGIGADEFSYNKWTGDGNWNTPANWSQGTPTSESPVVKIVSGALVNDLSTTISDFVISSIGKVTNTGTLNSTSMNILSDATGTGTYVDNGTTTISGTTTVQQHLTGALTAELPSGRFWYVSSPVTGATSATFDAAGRNKAWSYTESAHGYTEIVVNATSLVEGTGYALRMGADTTVTFTGTLNTGNKTILLTRNDGNEKSGYNLIGNPYPSFLDWHAATVSASVLPTSIWTRSCTTGGTMAFDTYNASLNTGVSGSGNTVTQYIAPMQAFWVKVDAGNTTGSVSFTNAMRSIQDITLTTNKLKAPAVATQQLLRLQVSNGTNSDETVIAFNVNATDGFDNFDSPKMSNNNVTMPEIYTLAGTEKVAINGMKNMATMPLGFTTTQANTFSIQATEVKNFDVDTKIILIDNLLKTEQELNDGIAYNFTSDVSTGTSRFSVVFKTVSITTGIESTNLNVNIYRNSNGMITVNNNKNNGTEGTITISNAIGQTLVNTMTTGTSTVISKKFSSGVYFVTLNVTGNKTTKKVIIN